MAGVEARRRAVETAISREARRFAPPETADGRPISPAERFGWAEFTWEEMRERLSAEVVRHLQAVHAGDESLQPEAAEAIAAAAYRWARERGASHFQRWTAPIAAGTPERHEAFLRPTATGMVAGFSGAQLLGDGGGAWDPRAPMFLQEAPTGATLCIPCELPPGQGLRAPLRESTDAARAVLRTRHDAEPVAALSVSFFLIDAAYASLRPDLLRLGRSLFGKAPQTLQRVDRIPPRALALLHELSDTLIQRGVPVQGHAATRLPSQFALHTIATAASRAGDHDRLIQDALARIAPRHHLRPLTHPTPFPGFARQTRTVTWWLRDAAGGNLIAQRPALRDRLAEAVITAGAELGSDDRVRLHVDADTPIAGALTRLHRAVTSTLSGEAAPADAVLSAIASQEPPRSRGRVRFQASVAAPADSPPDPQQRMDAGVLLELTQRVLLPTARAEPFFPDELLRGLEERCAALTRKPESPAAFDALQETFLAAEEEIADERWPLPRATEILLQGV